MHPPPGPSRQTPLGVRGGEGALPFGGRLGPLGVSLGVHQNVFAIGLYHFDRYSLVI